MNKTTEALKLAEEALVKANHFHDYEDALAAIREALAEQSKCACDSPAWCTKYKKCNREMLGLPKAEPVKQKPVAHYKDAPHTIYLQTGCDDPDPVNCECAFNEWGDTSWCADQIHDTDIPYIRADYAAPVDAKAIRSEALEEAAKVCEAKQSYNAMHANTEFAAAIRARSEK